MKYCMDCGGVNRDEARFCGHCGQAFWIDTPGQTEPAGSSMRGAKWGQVLQSHNDQEGSSATCYAAIPTTSG